MPSTDRCIPATRRGRRVEDRAVQLIRRALAEALAVVLPVECSGCSEPGWAVCPGCAGLLTASPSHRLVGGVRVFSSCTYADEVARIVTAFKDSGRVDAAGALGVALTTSVEAALGYLAREEIEGEDPELLAVPIPGSKASRRRRGYDPVELVAKRAGVPLHDVLRPTRTVHDQATLGVLERHSNRLGSLAASRDLAGVAVILIDDVVTTGATLLDAARAVREAGGEVRGAATVAATPLRGRPASSPV